jgi:Domain of unknown function (DUF6398)
MESVKSSNEDVLSACREQLDRYFATHPNPPLQARSMKALRLLASAEKPLAGQAEGWAAGVVYAVANLDRQACGAPGLLNAEFAKMFGVSIETIRRRAASIVKQITI